MTSYADSCTPEPNASESEFVDDRGSIRLRDFDNKWYRPGRSLPVRITWMMVNRVFFLTSFPWPSAMKRGLLRAFGAAVGAGVVLKPRINVKYPWHLTLGDYCWIGEGTWLDSLAPIRIGHDACLSQACMIETGNHDWCRPTFDLQVSEVIIEEGAWAAVRSLILPGSRLASHAILGAGSVLRGDTEPYGIYVGVPAVKIRDRRVSGS